MPSKAFSVKVAAAALITVLAVGGVPAPLRCSAAVTGLLGDAGSW